MRSFDLGSYGGSLLKAPLQFVEARVDPARESWVSIKLETRRALEKPNPSIH